MNRGRQHRPVGAEELVRVTAAELILKRPGSRGWDRYLNHVADAGTEQLVIGVLERALDELKADVATWKPRFPLDS